MKKENKTIKKEIKGAIIGIISFITILMLVVSFRGFLKWHEMDKYIQSEFPSIRDRVVKLEYGYVKNREFQALLDYFCLDTKRYTDESVKINKSKFLDAGRCNNK